MWERTERVESGSSRELRGGSYQVAVVTIQSSWNLNNSFLPNIHSADFGFRVASPVPEAIPTVSQWGMIALVLLLLTAGTIVYTKRHPLAA